MPVFYDKSNTPLRNGDYIVYAVNVGRSAHLRYAKVIGTKTAKIKGWSSSEPILRVKLKIHACDYYKGADAFTHNISKDEVAERPARGVLAGRVSYLEFSERLLCISGDQMPAEVLSELAPLEVD